MAQPENRFSRREPGEDKAARKVKKLRFQVVKNGVTLGGHTDLDAAKKLAAFVGGQVIDLEEKKR